MEIIKLPLGQLATNCYILKKENEVIIIDPGAEFNRIKQAVGDSHVNGVLLTHGHFDHINAVNDVLNEYHCPYYVSEKDFRLIKKSGAKLSNRSFHLGKTNITYWSSA